VGRQDEESDNEEGEKEEKEESTTRRPPLYPVLVNLFATALGADEAQANKSVDRFIKKTNGIDPDATTTTTRLPPRTRVPDVTEAQTEKDTTPNEEDEEEEEEEGSRRRRRRY